ncbi:hypothetical protein D9613_006422 [Agrocybe pediades]|uniref:Uncharacterized protein n=1 Tax=Agrocybe pediades TaxID=84607 RepID=A0A8H4VRE4_9AGAR|nr:hypothetical protein D9613_006422 [Agrocybe pediades]
MASSNAATSRNLREILTSAPGDRSQAHLMASISGLWKAKTESAREEAAKHAGLKKAERAATYKRGVMKQRRNSGQGKKKPAKHRLAEDATTRTTATRRARSPDEEGVEVREESDLFAVHISVPSLVVDQEVPTGLEIQVGCSDYAIPDMGQDFNVHYVFSFEGDS